MNINQPKYYYSVFRKPCHVPFCKKQIGWHPANSAEGQHSHRLCILSVLHVSAALAASQKYVAAQQNPTCRVVECAQACMTGIVGRQHFNFSDSV
jgi:hypothetical protein